MTAGTVVVLRALGLGDLLTAVPAIRAIRRAFPDDVVVLATSASMADFASACELADDVVAVEPLGPLPTALRGAAVAVNLHGRGPQSHRVLQAMEPGRIVAFANAEAGVGGPAWRPDEHEVERWCRMLDEHGIVADATDLALPTALFGPPSSPSVVVHPGAAFPSRRWPIERWAAVAAALAGDGTPVVLTGSADEAGRCRDITERAGLPESTCLAGETDLPALARTIAGAALVVSGDTGVAHLATAFGRPSVVLFGPVPPSEWGPPAWRRQHVALWAGQRGDPHGSETDPGLLSISVDQVLGGCRQALAAA